MANSMIRRLGMITGGYPSVATPTNRTYVQQLAHAFARIGVHCTVFSPVNLHRSLDRTGYPYHSVESVDSGTDVHVFRPRFMQYWGRGGMANWGVLNLQRIMLHSFVKSVSKTIKRQNLQFDAMYGHFLYAGGAAAIRLGRMLKIPAFPGMGESTDGTDQLWTVKPYGIAYAECDVKDATGIITNASLLADLVGGLFDYPSERIGVFPNGTNLKLFKPSDTNTSRKQFGFPDDDLIVACVGHFSDRKGQQRLMEAIQPLTGVSAVFVGNGIPYEKDSKVLWNTALNQDRIPALLSACDVFVLPTLREGSCNVIVEAMACGLPVISSECAFNDDLLTDDMSIRVDPKDIQQIREAIVTLRDDPIRRKQMAEAALERSVNFDVNIRASRILEFMELHAS